MLAHLYQTVSDPLSGCQWRGGRLALTPALPGQRGRGCLLPEGLRISSPSGGSANFSLVNLRRGKSDLKKLVEGGR